MSDVLTGGNVAGSVSITANYQGMDEMATDNCTLQAFGQTFKNDNNTGNNSSNNANLLDLMVQFTQPPNYSLRK